MNDGTMHDRDPSTHPERPEATAFGLIFCGPPGVFSTWSATPDGGLLTREAAERLGQAAVRAGVADYRVFSVPDPPPGLPFASADGLAAAIRLISAHSGVPPSSDPLSSA